MKRQESLPARYWEPGCDESVMSDKEIEQVQEWIEKNGIPYDPELPFN